MHSIETKTDRSLIAPHTISDSFNYEIGTFLVVVVIVFAIFLAALILLIIFYTKTKQKHEQVLLEKELNKLNEINQTKIEIKDQTLKEIGRELHDNIGQLLIVTRIQLKEMMSELSHPKLESLNSITEKTLNEVRLLSKLINSDIVLENGLLGSLENQKTLLEKSGVYQLLITELGTSFKINHSHELILFRILQECISNAIKYSENDAFDITLNYQNPFLTITFNDNGKGFDIAKTPKGNGLTNMKNRAEIINTTFTIHSEINAGTTITLNYKNHE